MPITMLDFILLGVMLISGLLAMIRGFFREILSIAGWVAAAGVTLYAFAKLKPVTQQYINNDTVASAVTAAGVFLLTLIIVSVFTVRISDKILDSRVGALDRTLGFLFGLARGLIIVAVAYIFFDWLVPKQQPTWIANAKSRVVLQATGSWLMSLLPEDVDKYISKALKKGPKGGDEDAPPDAPPDQRTDMRPPAGAARSEATGYDRGDRAGMRQLIETKR
jgi:membrane protein required for colicin V production